MCSHWPAKLLDQRLRTRVGEHPLHLLLEHGRLVQRLLLRHVQELVIRDAAPQEERQARRQLEIGDAIRRIRRRALRLTLEAEQELRAHEDAANRQLEARLEAALRPRRRGIEPSGDLRSSSVDRPSIGAPRERRDDLLGARRFVRGGRRPADEQARRRLGESCIATAAVAAGAGDRTLEMPGSPLPAR